jgi:type I restriction-modification system DNA methylase subunit
LTSKTSGEGDIRKELIEARLVDCIVNMPAKLKAEFEEQLKEEVRLNKLILENLGKIEMKNG